jgi:hypothetical protein
MRSLLSQRLQTLQHLQPLELPLLLQQLELLLLLILQQLEPLLLLLQWILSIQSSQSFQ